MENFLWHLLYITANCTVAILVWVNRRSIGLWLSGAFANLRQRIKDRTK